MHQEDLSFDARNVGDSSEMRGCLLKGPSDAQGSVLGSAVRLFAPILSFVSLKSCFLSRYHVLTLHQKWIELVNSTEGLQLCFLFPGSQFLDEGIQVPV
jgi:hypothetical protein